MRMKRLVKTIPLLLFIITVGMSSLLFQVSAEAGRGISVDLRKYESPNAPVDKSITLYDGSKALVIGIDDYHKGWPRLSNAVADAKLVADALRKKGFDVEIKTDLNARDLENVLEDPLLF